MEWCERRTTGGETWNTWSSFGLSLCSLPLLHRGPASRRAPAAALLWTGLASAAFHHEPSWLTRVADEGGIAALVVLYWRHAGGNWPVAGALLAAGTVVLGPLNCLVLMGVALATSTLEAPTFRRSTLQIFFLAFLAWCADHFWCPGPVQWHALWHVLAGVAASMAIEDAFQ